VGKVASRGQWPALIDRLEKVVCEGLGQELVCGREAGCGCNKEALSALEAVGWSTRTGKDDQGKAPEEGHACCVGGQIGSGASAMQKDVSAR